MIRGALKNPHLIVVVALAVMVLGVASYRKIPADLLPIFNTPAVQIVTFYPGMPPEVVEQDITSRMERWTAQSVGIDHQESKSMLGVSVVKDFFREDISMETAMAQVTSYAVSDMYYLPPGTVPPMVMPFDPTASVPLCLVSVSSTEMSEKELYDIAYFELRNRLQAIQGVIAPAVYGGKLRRILAYLDRDKLDARGLSLMDVQRALRQQNVLIPAGNAKMGETDFQIFTNALPDTVDAINLTPIKTVDGHPVLLRDVGEVQDTGQIQTNIVRTNGARQVYIPIYRQPGANTIAIVDSIKDGLGRISERLKERNADDPKMQSLVLSVVMDQSVGVRQSIQSLQVEGLLGALLAGLVVVIFLRNLRLTLIILLAIPLSILAALMGLFYTGDTLNAMTLGGLALAVGILIDQSIVVLENVVRHSRMGKSPMEAAVDGTREVAMPILVSTITFCIVFYPIVFLSGIPRFLFTPLAVAVTLTIVASYFVAIFFVPTVTAKLLARGTLTSAGEDSQGWLGPVIRGYGWLLRRTLRWKWAVILASVLIFAGSMLLFRDIGQELFPATDGGQFTMLVRLPSGTRIERTEETIARIEQVITDRLGEPDPAFAIGEEQHPTSALQMVISNIGVLMDWPAAYTPNTGPMDAFVLVQLKDKPGRPDVFDLVADLRRDLNEKFPGVEFAFDTGGMTTAALNMGEPSPIHFQVTGSKLDAAQKIARLVKAEAEQIPGTADVRIAQRLDYPVLNVEMDRVLAAHQGVTVDDVMKNLVSATNSSIGFDPAFWIDERNGNHYFMGVQYREEDINSLDTLRYVPVTGSGSVQPVPLENVAKITQTTGPSVVHHRNITRATDIYANVLPGYDAGSVVKAIERRLESNPELDLVSHQTERGPVYDVAGPDYAGKGYSIEMQGEVKSMRDAFDQFATGMGIAALLIFLVMVALLRSFVTPWVVMVTIPLGLVGVAVALWATDTSLNIQSLMGIMMMMGIVVEYSIVLLDFADRRVEEGATPEEAVYEAATVRFVPILMTSVTTILAVSPMALGLTGHGTDQPLAIAIVGGVAAATLLPKFVVPCLYALLKRPARHSGLMTA
ncbi:MAG: efflux RND transporter permease subunit [Planctomycetota bacterium]|nr:efflux RND transporter permease subunit [Planctomycetaceae bacterium]MDQ3329961.1 efflux RND transporter permease subunit [Planctomycetota bacterium]